jgi:hypothetical protein
VVALVGVLLVCLFFFLWFVNVRWNRRFGRSKQPAYGVLWDERARMDYVLPYDVRPAWQSVASAVGVLPLAVYVMWLLFGTGSWIVAVAFWLLLFVQFVWASGISFSPIVITASEVRQSRRRIRHDDVRSIHVVRKARGRVDAYALELTTQKAPVRTLLYLTSFGAKDLAILVDAVASHAPTAGLDSGARALRAGTWSPGME